MPKKPPTDKKPARDLRGRTRFVAPRPGIPRSAAELMSNQGLLAGLRKAQAVQEDWLAWLRARLPAELAGAATAANPKGEELVVMARTAAWSSRLRYALAGIEPELVALGKAPQRITVKVSPTGRSGA